MIAVVAAASMIAALTLFWPATRSSRSSTSVGAPGRRFDGRLVVAAGSLGALVLVGPVFALIGGAAVVVARWWRRRMVRTGEAAAVRTALPAAIDLIAAVLGAGGSVRQAFVVLDAQGPAALRSALRRADDHRSAGVAFATWSETFLGEAGEDYRPLVRALLATERDGAPVATLLERLAEESRRARGNEREIAAKRLPLLLLGPLALCSLPAVLVGSIVPLVLVALGAVDLG